MRRSALIASSIVLDALLGDPPDWPHPVRGIGALIDYGEAFLRERIEANPHAEQVAGAALTLGVVGIAACVGLLVRKSPAGEIPLAASTLALRSLLDQSESVARALGAKDLTAARANLARIVGRDTDALDESDIARATIETLAESLCDGVIAPLFYLAIAGVPGALAYKAVNTLDSMIGHIEAPYRNFGRFAARLDDVVNWIPARIAATCIVVAAGITDGTGAQAWNRIRRDGAKSLSPNAGQTEAAMAGALGVRLGGINTYDGVTLIGATFGAAFAPPKLADIRLAQRITVIAASIAYTAALIGTWCVEEG